MADIKKEQERDELHKAIWSIADDLRGAVDGWDFKQYVLGIMFYRYVSENLTNYIDEGEHAAGNAAFDYTTMSDDEAEGAREGLVEEKGFFILPSELFCNVRKRADKDENLNETLERIFNHIEDSAKGSDSESDFAGLFDDIDVNSNKLGATVAKRNEKLVKLLNGIGDMKLGNYQDNTIDAFGDAYEFLMGMYASNAGKSGGEYYTPQEVSELWTKLAIVGKKEINKIYDPACGSGSLLLKAAKILGKENVRQGFFGQEVNITTYNLCRINMFLHDIGFDKFSIACEDTLVSPQHWDDEPFEVIVSNPPYSIKWEGDENPLLINDPRFAPAGVLAPKSKADLAFIMHSLSWLATNGTAAIVCFPGIMYRGGAEQKIRKYLIDNNYVDCVIQLPGNLFFGTSIATCIMVLKKAKTDNNILFIDATKECIKVTNNNKLTGTNIENIVGQFTSREEKAHYAHLASYDEVSGNDYNLSVSTYVEAEDTREQVDIVKLNAEIKEIVAREQFLRDEIDKIIADIEGGQN
jgi:type I restriction enzyme M protein